MPCETAYHIAGHLLECRDNKLMCAAGNELMMHQGDLDLGKLLFLAVSLSHKCEFRWELCGHEFSY